MSYIKFRSFKGGNAVKCIVCAVNGTAAPPPPLPSTFHQYHLIKRTSPSNCGRIKGVFGGN